MPYKKEPTYPLKALDKSLAIVVEPQDTQVLLCEIELDNPKFKET